MNGHDGGPGEDEVCIGTDFYRLQWRVGRDRERERERRERERERETTVCTLVAEELRKKSRGPLGIRYKKKKFYVGGHCRPHLGLIPVSARGLRLREPRQAHDGVCLLLEYKYEYVV
jgi:hypothetical protein